VQVKLLDWEQDGVTYIRLKDDDEEGENGIEFGIRVDERLMNGKDAFASVNQAVSLTNNSGFLTVIGSIPKTINGASMGLAVAIECCRPGKYDNAFTGFVSNMNENDLTCRVHDIDNVTIKIQGCAKQKVPLVVPFSAEVAKLRRIVISPKDVCRGDIDTSLSTYSAYTMLEAISMANVINSRNVSDVDEAMAAPLAAVGEFDLSKRSEEKRNEIRKETLEKMRTRLTPALAKRLAQQHEDTYMKNIELSREMARSANVAYAKRQNPLLRHLYENSLPVMPMAQLQMFPSLRAPLKRTQQQLLHRQMLLEQGQDYNGPKPFVVEASGSAENRKRERQ